MTEQSVFTRKLKPGPIYGWVIVLIAALAMVATLPGRTYGLGMITERLLADSRFDWSSEHARIEYADINLWATLIGGLFCLPCGWLIDRYGLRWTLTATILFLAGAVFWMARARNLEEFSFAILLTRGFGQSALSVISITMVGKWFRGRLGVPMAIYTVSMSLGFAYAFRKSEEYIWNWTLLWDDIGYCLFAAAAIAAILTFEPPTRAHTASAEEEHVEEPGFTVGQALLTPAFMVFGLSISLVALAGAGQSLFNESLLAELGFERNVFYELLQLGPVIGMCCQLPVGWLSGRVPMNRMLAVGMLLLAGCQATLPAIGSKAGILTYAVVMGVSGSITTVLFFTIWGQAYGRKHLGKIQGVAQMLTVLASALGPRVFAEFHARFGNYDGALFSMAGFGVAIAVWSLLIRVPRPEDAPRSHSLQSSFTVPQEP